MKRVCLSLFLFIFFTVIKSAAAIREFDFVLYDTLRNRPVPVAVYAPDEGDIPKKEVIIFSHGYDANRGGSYKVYSYLTRTLAEAGYCVISIQHELPDDDLLAMEGELRITRRPNWQRGVENIRFIKNELLKILPDAGWENLTLIGHSNGGDVSMLYATLYPEELRRVVSLDHRRMPVPRIARPQIGSLRGCDYPADEEVLPHETEQQEYGIVLIDLPGIRHGDMDDKGAAWQKERITDHILRLLQP